VGGRSVERFLGQNRPLLFLWQNWPGPDGCPDGWTDKRTAEKSKAMYLLLFLNKKYIKVKINTK
jgi:hypothetical protein